ncbi:MAG: NAD/FAD-utilizing enzyme [bacterium]
MKRHYYISDDLDDLDLIEEELEERGVYKPQIHVFSKDDAGVDAHDHLHNIYSIFKTDIIHGAATGLWIGVILASIILVATSYGDWAVSYTWTPFILAAIIVLGFSVWIGGLYGIQGPHHDFKQFEPQLRKGKHVFVVDVKPDQEARLAGVVLAHPRLELAGTSRASPRWIVMGQQNLNKLVESFP